MEDANVFKFPTTKLLSTEFNQNSTVNMIDRVVEIRVMEIFTEIPKKKKDNEPVKPIEKEYTVGKTHLTFLDAIIYAKNSVYVLKVLDEKGRPRFRMYLQKFSIKQHYTFMDLYIKNSLNIVPIIGVDYSLANLTFDDTQHCIHTVKEDKPNDYVSCLNAVNKAYSYFSRFNLSYGFGASTFLKGDHPACPIFSMTGDFQSPFVSGSNTELNKNYYSTLKSVKLGLPVLYKEILKFVCDLAETELVNAQDTDDEEDEDAEDGDDKKSQ